MNLSEFKAWFEGYTEAMEGRPTEKQWKRIQGRVKEIKDAPTPYPTFIDRYWPQRIYQDPTVWYGATTAGGAETLLKAQGAAQMGQTLSGKTTPQNFTAKAEWNSDDAFRDLGRADALNGDAS